MWIDINNHVGQWPYKKLIYDDCKTLTERMDRFGIDVSIITSLNGIHYKNTQSANRDVFRDWNSSGIFKERLIPYGVINPTYAGWQYDLRQCLEEFDMKGIAVYPKYHDYTIQDERLIELTEMMEEYGLPVALTLRMVDHRERSWMDIDREWALIDVMPLIRAVPHAKFLIWNVANSTRLDEKDLNLVRKGDIMMDTSGRATNHLGTLIQEFGVDKFAYGSHAPILDYATGRLRIEFLDADEQVKNQLRYANAQAMLSI